MKNILPDPLPYRHHHATLAKRISPIVDTAVLVGAERVGFVVTLIMQCLEAFFTE